RQDNSVQSCVVHRMMQRIACEGPGAGGSHGATSRIWRRSPTDPSDDARTRRPQDDIYRFSIMQRPAKDLTRAVATARSVAFGGARRQILRTTLSRVVLRMTFSFVLESCSSLGMRIEL